MPSNSLLLRTGREHGAASTGRAVGPPQSKTLGSYMTRIAVTPSKRITLWVLANLLWLGSVPAQISYLVREQNSGAFPVEADSIGIPIVGWALGVLVLTPFLNAAWWWLSRDYPGSVPLFAKTESLSLVENVISVSLVIVAAAFALLAVWEAVVGAPELAAVVLAWSYLSLAFRAAYLKSAGRGEAVAA